MKRQSTKSTQNSNKKIRSAIAKYLQSTSTGFFTEIASANALLLNKIDNSKLYDIEKLTKELCNFSISNDLVFDPKLEAMDKYSDALDIKFDCSSMLEDFCGLLEIATSSDYNADEGSDVGNVIYLKIAVSRLLMFQKYFELISKGYSPVCLDESGYSVGDNNQYCWYKRGMPLSANMVFRCYTIQHTVANSIRWN